MHDWILAHEPWLRVGAFAGVLLLMLVAEHFRPRRGEPMHRRERWGTNLSIVVLDVLLVRLLIPLGATGAAIWAEVHGYGLLHRADLPFAVEAGLAFLA